MSIQESTCATGVILPTLDRLGRLKRNDSLFGWARSAFVPDPEPARFFGLWIQAVSFCRSKRPLATETTAHSN
ncbi:hypothetical protein MPNT_10370 [Candidatus Methylacidithermus pantelleriae]|uniref:Uncharacterized protein n=1 Tax=Candidatus Methylacidithermus pantelleriae TaxID=2744239 RepID=A0A8J2BMG5_9BACT|nr:hypothetical protein MPNT_10370 [Candidatus Methylacidithermus pantelleriae]